MNFGQNIELYFYLDEIKLESIMTDNDGSFNFTSKIPDDSIPERGKFSIRDSENNEKCLSVRLS
ncbi:MAG: hypothetical protein COA77_10705 [Thaumarchaeota archaeon]|nr:MAG: hypothetical protein COA77_10705 [Nitrososphaerota archaeon]